MLLGVTVHWAGVYCRIWRITLPSGARTHGTKQLEIAHSSRYYWRVLVVRPTRSAKVLSTSEGGTDGTCEPQIVALPSGLSVPRTDQKVQHNQGSGSHTSLYR